MDPLAYSFAIIFAISFSLCAGMIRLGLPIAARLSIAIPNARSSHDIPTPQSGGLFLVASLLLCGLGFAFVYPDVRIELMVILSACLVLNLMGWADDRYGLAIWTRFLTYAGISFAYGFSREFSFLGPGIDSWVSSLLAALFLLVLINVTNFMDGIDGMVVVEFVPMLSLVAFLSLLGTVGTCFGFLATALVGALLGFFLFNRPKAKIFLGDAGALVVGFLAGVILLELANNHGFILALLLPLYFFCDAGLTLLRRIFRGERFWEAHREHFYQRALDAGQSNWSIIARVAILNSLLSLIVYITLKTPAPNLLLACSIGCALTSVLLWKFFKPQKWTSKLSKDSN